MPARCWPGRWTTRRRCARWPGSRCRKSPIGAASCSSTWARASASSPAATSDPALEAALLEIRAKRREEEGASESRRVAQTGEPILATDVRATIDETIEDHQRELIERLAPKSYLIVPLAARGRVLGSMTLLSTRAGRHYTESDLAFAAALAERCALAIDNARLHDRAERSLSLLDTVFSTAPVGLALVDRDLRFVRVNETFAAFNARPVGELVGRTCPSSCVPRPDEETVVPSYRQVLDSGGPVLDRELTTHGRDGTARHWNASFTPVTHADGSVTGVIVSVMDVTERRALLEAEREARVRADFLARAGAILDASLDYEETLASVAQIAIPEVADWCAVSVLDDAGVLQEVATAHVDEGQREIGARDQPPLPGRPRARTAARYGVARSGETVYVREVTDEMLVAGISGSRAPRPRPPARACARSSSRRSRPAAGRSARSAWPAPSRAGSSTRPTSSWPRSSRRAPAWRSTTPGSTPSAAGSPTPSRSSSCPSACRRSRARSWPPATAPPASSTRSAATSTTSSSARRPSGRSSSATCRARGPRPPPSPRWRATRCAPRRSRTRRPSGALQRLNTAMLYDDTSQFATVVMAYLSAGPDGSIDLRLALAGHPPPAVVRRDGSVEMVGPLRHDGRPAPGHRRA